MAFQFPAAPIVGQTFTPTAGVTYRWNGTAWYLIQPGALDTTMLGQPNGVASLDATGKVPAAQLPINALRSYLAGFGMTPAGASMSVAAGLCADSTNVSTISLAAAMSKTTAAWVAGNGNGGLDTGAIAINVFYFWFVIRNPSTLAVDVLFSLSPTAPTLPSGFTQFRRIGAAKTNGSSQWIPFTQRGDDFTWATPIQDFNDSSTGTGLITKAVSVPGVADVKARIIFNLRNTDTGNTSSLYVHSLSEADVAPSLTLSQISNIAEAGIRTDQASAELSIYSGATAQIAYRVTFGSALVVISGNTLGWNDRRGRDD